MTELEPVAWTGAGDDGVIDIAERRDIAEQWLSDGLKVEPLVRLSDAEARIRELEAAAREYVAAVNGDPEQDIWDTEDGKEAPGAARTSSDWAWEMHDTKKQAAFDALVAALKGDEQ